MGTCLVLFIFPVRLCQYLGLVIGTKVCSNAYGLGFPEPMYYIYMYNIEPWSHDHPDYFSLIGGFSDSPVILVLINQLSGSALVAESVIYT